ncbi:MAG: hypothetical protein ACP5FT_00105 [Acidilobus sp.]
MMRRRGWYDPRVYGPASRWLNLLNALSVPASISTLLIAVAIYVTTRKLLLPATIAALAVVIALSSRLAVRLYSYVISSGVEGELPAALALLIPYAASSRDLANLLIYAAKELRLRFLSKETWRLRALLATGMDERSALRYLANTTSSQRLREVVRELLNAEELGVSRSRLATEIYSRALNMTRSVWSAYAKVGEVLVEGVITLVASIAILVPVAAIGMAQILPLLGTVSAVVSVGSALALIVMRPELGDVEGGWAIGLVTLSSTLLAAMLLFRGFYVPALALLAAAAAYTELASVRLERGLTTAIARLREAATRARLGLSFEEQLSAASSASGKIVEAVARAYRIAGRVGLGGAMEAFADLLSDAVRAVQSVRLEGVLLEAISAVVPSISIVALKMMASYVASAPFLGPIGMSSLAGSIGVITFTAPLAPLPAAALQRGRRLTAGPSLLAVIAAWLAVKVL